METTQTHKSKQQPKWLAHVYMLSFSVLAMLVFGFLNNSEPRSDTFILLFFVIFIQLEFFIWLGKVLFKTEPGTTPKEITKKIVKRYALFHITCFVGAALIYLAVLALLYVKNGAPLNELIPNVIKWELKGWLVATNLGLLIGAFLFFFIQWQEALKKAHKLREEKLAFQYETLNQQVNPHFLFNSLNTLASFIKTNPDVAEEYVNKLAQIYRYITDNASKNSVPLNEEVSFIKDYFYLQKLRDNGKIDLEIDIPDDNNFNIIPVSLQLLIENALKHNMATKTSPLTIKLSVIDDFVVVQNNLQKKTTLEASLKKGLNNLKERVKLTTGKQTEIIETTEAYTVKVPLQ